MRCRGLRSLLMRLAGNILCPAYWLAALFAGGPGLFFHLRCAWLGVSFACHPTPQARPLQPDVFPHGLDAVFRVRRVVGKTAPVAVYALPGCFLAPPSPAYAHAIQPAGNRRAHQSGRKRHARRGEVFPGLRGGRTVPVQRADGRAGILRAIVFRPDHLYLRAGTHTGGRRGGRTDVVPSEDRRETCR